MLNYQFLDIPEDILAAERKISLWVKENDFHDWAIGDICDRNYMEKLLAYEESKKHNQLKKVHQGLSFQES